MKLAANRKYKESHVEWLGEVPQHWEVHKITRGFTIIASGTTPKSDSPDYYDGDVPWVTTSELRETVIRQTKQSLTRQALRDYPTLRMYPTGTILFAMYGATIGRLGILGMAATVNQACCAFSSPTKFDSRFIYYWLWMRRPILISLSSGGGQPNLSQDDLRQLRVPVPEVDEQQAIADFLDRETARLDTSVGKKRKLIEKLKEKRTALISRTVTRGLPVEAAAKAGLNPHPKFKPAGIEWLGDIPEHWEMKKLGYVARLKSGENITTEELENEGDYPVFGGNGLRGYSSRFNRDGNYVLIGRQGALCGNINYASGRFWASEHAVVAHPIAKLSTIWFGELLRAMNLNQYSVSAAQPGLSVDMISDLKIPVPPSKEQGMISEYLDCETAKIDKMMEKVEAAIEKLQEYRTALITAAVTGKIDVRGEANSVGSTAALAAGTLPA